MMLRRFRPYLIRDSYSAQIEGSAFVNLRVGYTCLGVATFPYLGVERNQTWWQRLLPIVSLTLVSHTGQCDRWRIVRLQVCRRVFVTCTTRGDAAYAVADR